MNHQDPFAAPAIDIIRSRWPHIQRQLKREPLWQDIQLITEKPQPSFVCNGIQLASAYDPDAEAILQTSTVPSNPETLRVYGVGMGYLPRLLLERYPSLKTLEVYIFNASLFWELLNWVDQSDWLSDERVVLKLPSSDSRPQPPWVVTPPCLWLADERAGDLRNHLLTKINEENIKNLYNKRDPILKQHLRDNITTIEQDGDVAQLFGTLVNEPPEVVVAGAGPSLDRSASLIAARQAQGALLIAVDAALKPLLRTGVIPDILITIDPLRDGVLPNFQGDLRCLHNATLVYFPVVAPDVLNAWPYKRMTAYSSHEFYRAVKRAHPRGELHTFGSVIHPAIDLAVKMGACRITLAGADFSFPSGKTHAKGFPHGKQMDEKEQQQSAHCWVRNGYGEKVISSINMIGYQQDLEKYISFHPLVEFINLSREGAAIAGTRYPEEQS
ncbi:MAG: 6-hydroxymethylpterin diphosphokinase MptE-like protein [Sedimenticola sp.]